MNNNISPEYLSSLVPQPVENTTSYGLWDASNIRQPLSRTQLYYKSFLPSSIRLWNDLSLETRETNSFMSFKYQLNKNINKPPRNYLVGDRFSQIQHTRFCKNSINDPECQCGSLETTKHYISNARDIIKHVRKC